MCIFSFIVFVAVVVMGCASPLSTGQTAPERGAGPVDEARVLAIARAAVAANDTWLNRAEFEKPKRRPDGSWSVLVWRRPATPGGQRVISIDAKGRVANYGRGA